MRNFTSLVKAEIRFVEGIDPILTDGDIRSLFWCLSLSDFIQWLRDDSNLFVPVCANITVILQKNRITLAPSFNDKLS